jgi:hypothetical protein
MYIRNNRPGHVKQLRNDTRLKYTTKTRPPAPKKTQNPNKEFFDLMNGSFLPRLRDWNDFWGTDQMFWRDDEKISREYEKLLREKEEDDASLDECDAEGRDCRRDGEGGNQSCEGGNQQDYWARAIRKEKQKESRRRRGGSGTRHDHDHEDRPERIYVDHNPFSDQFNDLYMYHKDTSNALVHLESRSGESNPGRTYGDVDEFLAYVYSRAGALAREDRQTDIYGHVFDRYKGIEEVYEDDQEGDEFDGWEPGMDDECLEQQRLELWTELEKLIRERTVCFCVYTHTYIHTYIHTYMHT